MRIGIDCRFWSQTGVGRYTRNLVENLAKIDRANDYVLFVRSEDLSNVKSVVSTQMSVVKADVPWHGIAEQLRFPKILNSENLDLVHFPYFSVPYFYKKPFVITVHDLIINRFNTGRASTLPYPLYFAKRVGYKAVLASALTRAKKIIVPSNSVRDDVLSTYTKLPAEKVCVTYEGGFKSGLKPKARSKVLVDGRYLIRVGNFYPHKNVERLLFAFRDFVYDSYENRDMKLVLVGKKDFFYNKIAKLIANLNIGEHVVFFENIKDEALLSLYQNAVAVIIPSFMEGFSLTAVEGMSCGVPVIASDIATHREICGTAAIYCNPGDPSDIKHKINFVCSFTPSTREEIIEQGKKQSEKYSWEKMAKETLSIYKEAV